MNKDCRITIRVTESEQDVFDMLQMLFVLMQSQHTGAGGNLSFWIRIIYAVQTMESPGARIFIGGIIRNCCPTWMRFCRASQEAARAANFRKLRLM